MNRLSRLLLCGAVAVGCSGTPVRYYQPQVARMERAPAGEQVPVTLSVASFTADLAYDDQRIVYRESPQRFDYYHFHRWSAAPGALTATLLRETYRQGGRFKHVVGGLDPRSDVILSGRVVALEEVDLSTDEWLVYVALELTLRDSVTGRVLLNELVESKQAVAEKEPEGVAAALGKALTRIGVETAPRLARAAVRALGNR